MLVMMHPVDNRPVAKILRKWYHIVGLSRVNTNSNVKISVIFIRVTGTAHGQRKKSKFLLKKGAELRYLVITRSSTFF